MTPLDTDTSLQITRTFKATREKVYDAFMLPELRKQWWRTKPEESCTICDIDERVGGHYRINRLTPEGEYIVVGTFQELVRPKRMVFSWCWEIPAGGETNTLVTVDLKAIDERSTELTLTHERLSSPEMRDLHIQIWNGCLTSLAALVETKS